MVQQAPIKTVQTDKNKSVSKIPKISAPKSINNLVIIAIAIIAGFGGGWVGAQSKFQNATSGTNTEAQQQIVSSESDLISKIAKDVGPSVVSVNVTSESNQTDFFGFSRPSESQSAGTGFIITKEGLVVTNRHVVPAGTTKVSLVMSDGTELNDVEVIGRTNDSDPLDVAFLKIKDTKGKELKPATLGDSSKVQVGEKVVAIGNALGQFQNTVTSGIISGYGRSIEASDGNGAGSETLQNLFQTDTAINQGNSGGPLVNMSGQVIGINVAIAGGAENIGFAIPINDVNGLIKTVTEKGKLERPYLGVRYVSLTDDIAYEYNLPVKRGAYIAPGKGQDSILENSPASKAGLKEKDIITHIDGTAIDENHNLISILGQKSPGDSVELTVLRDGKEQKITVKLEAAPQQ